MGKYQKGELSEKSKKLVEILRNNPMTQSQIEKIHGEGKRATNLFYKEILRRKQNSKGTFEYYSSVDDQTFVDPEKVVSGIFKRIEDSFEKIRNLTKELNQLREENADLKEENQQLRTLAGKAQSKGIVVPSYALPR